LIAIVAALEEELAPLRKRLRASLRDGEARSRLCRAELGGKTILLARTGLGPARARAAAASLVEQHDLEAIVSIGFAGAVSGSLHKGDLLIASRVHAPPEEPESEPPATLDGLDCDAGLVDLAVETAQQSELPFQVGYSLTVPDAASDRRTKERIGRRWPVAVVEMESYWIARAAAVQGIPFLTVRAVSDALGDALPDLGGLIDADGSTHALRLPAVVLRRPFLAPVIVRLAVAARLASRNLATFTEAFVLAFPSRPGADHDRDRLSARSG